MVTPASIDTVRAATATPAETVIPSPTEGERNVPGVDAAKRRVARDGYLKRTYGISIETYEEMLDQQGGRCAICLCRPRTRNLAVDHDHLCAGPNGFGKIRGLLCSRCNFGLLKFAQDDIVILKRAIEYLRKNLEGHSATEPPDDTACLAGEVLS